MGEVILDTSVLVKFFVPDEKDKTADQVLDKSAEKILSIVTIDIAVYELVNTFKLSKKSSAPIIYDNVSAMYKMAPRIITLSQELIKCGLDIMEKFPLTIYDAVFVAAAEMEKIPLLTADYKHHKKEISKYIVYYKEWHKRRLP